MTLSLDVSIAVIAYAADVLLSVIYVTGFFPTAAGLHRIGDQ